jgi:hypothetical protein
MEQLGKWVHRDHRERKALLVILVKMVCLENLVGQDLLASKAHEDLLEPRACRERWE